LAPKHCKNLKLLQADGIEKVVVLVVVNLVVVIFSLDDNKFYKTK
jgi:hypothetical protein